MGWHVRRSQPAAALMVTVLKSLPGAVDSDAQLVQHSDPARGIHLQFCEEPYRYFSWASQGVALIFHMPYVPSLVCRFSWNKMSPEIKKLLTFQIPLQLWTGFGHYLADSRTCKITEISIMIADLYFIQLIAACSRFPKDFSFWKVALIYTGFTFFIYNCFGLLTFILSNGIALPIIAFSAPDVMAGFRLGALVSPSGKFIGSILMLLTTFIIITEGTFCQMLIAIYPLPYHSAFDLIFFQVNTTFFLSLAINAQDKLHGKKNLKA